MDTTVPPPRAALLAWSTATFLREGRLAEALATCEEALGLAVASGSAEAEASVRTTLGAVLQATGRTREAGIQLAAALRVHVATGDARLAALTRQELAVVALHEGHPDEAERLLVEALRSHGERGELGFDGRARLRLAEAHHAAGHLEQALTEAQAVRQVAVAANDPATRAACDAVCGLVSLEAGRPRDALRTWTAALEDAASATPAVEVAIRTGLARVRAERRQEELARREATWAADLAAACGLVVPEGVALAVLAGSEGGAGRVDEAEAALARAEAALAGHPLWLELVPLARGHLDHARGHRDVALARLGAVPEAALKLVPVRLSLRHLRRVVARDL